MFMLNASWSRVMKREHRNDITIAPKYYQRAENQSAEIDDSAKKWL